MKGLAIYVTHGGASTLKIASKLFGEIKPEMQVIAYLKGDEYTIEQTPDGTLLPEKPLTFTEFIDLINHIKTRSLDLDPDEIKVCCDANLSMPSGYFVTKTLNDLLSHIKPQTVVLFLSTPECYPNAQKYLSGIPFNKTFQLPREVIKGFVADRRQLTHMIKQPMPRLIKKLASESNLITANDSEGTSHETHTNLNVPLQTLPSHKEAVPNFIERYFCWFKTNKVAPSHGNKDEDTQKPTPTHQQKK